MLTCHLSFFHSTDETKISGACPTTGWKYRHNSSSVEVDQVAASSSTKEAGWDLRDSTYKVSVTNGSKCKVVPSVQAKAKKMSSIIPKDSRNYVKRRLAIPRENNVALEAANLDDYKKSEKEELEHSVSYNVLSCEKLKEHRKGTFEKIFSGIDRDAVEENSTEVNHTKTRDNGQEFTRVISGKTPNSSAKALGKNGAKMWVFAVKNKVLVPLRFRQQTPTARRGKSSDLQASDRRDRYVKDSDSVTKANIREKVLTPPTKEHNAVVEEKPSPLSVGKLQKLIREKVLSQTQKSNRRANEKSVLPADYMRTLQKHMGIKDEVLESNSPDFSGTPFIAAEKTFGCEDEQDREPRAVDRRLETVQRQIVRFPTSFKLLDSASDLIED